MRLAHRTTLIIGACTVLVVGGAGLLQWRSEERDLRRVAESETRLLGRSLQVAFENALRDRQIDDVAETLGALEHVDPAVAIYVFDASGSLAGASSSALPSPAIERMAHDARHSAHTLVAFSPPEHPTVLRIAMLMHNAPLAGSAAMVLEKPLTEMQRDLAFTRRYTITTLATLVLTVAALARVISGIYVGKPLARLIADMRRVRGGDLVAAGARRSDELGAVQREFELLVRDLREARERAAAEAEARQKIERGLQHADKLITLGQLSAVLAHEIGSPLQVLEGRARALAKHPDDPQNTRRTAFMLVEQTERITRIVAQMLCMTRRKKPVRTCIDAEACVRRVVALLELEARRRDLRIVMDAGSGKHAVCADPDQLQQVALNLIRNALDASPAGGTVQVRCAGAPDVFVLEVQDEGPGIDPAIRPHFFEAFFTTKVESGGHGLGLSVVQAIVQEHHGQVIFPRVAAGCVARVQMPRGVEVCAA